jgi:hypothetical protein
MEVSVVRYHVSRFPVASQTEHEYALRKVDEERCGYLSCVVHGVAIVVFPVGVLVGVVVHAGPIESGCVHELEGTHVTESLDGGGKFRRGGVSVEENDQIGQGETPNNLLGVGVLHTKTSVRCVGNGIESVIVTVVVVGSVAGIVIVVIVVVVVVGRTIVVRRHGLEEYVGTERLTGMGNETALRRGVVVTVVVVVHSTAGVHVRRCEETLGRVDYRGSVGRNGEDVGDDRCRR